jgi:hypothetical protein
MITPRTKTYYAPAPICTAFWTADNWKRMERTKTEPLVIRNSFGEWHATHRGDDGELYYTLNDSVNEETESA